MPAAVYPMHVSSLMGKTSVTLGHGVEAATQSWGEGAPLVGSSGKLAEVGADPALVIGLSLKAASGVTDAPVVYAPIDRDTLIEISVNAQVTVANMHIAYGIVESSNIWILDTSETTATFGRIVEILPGMSGVDNPRVLVQPTLAAME